ncbi:hypothetical protein BJ973_008938 [Actinoplanes tereljensis]|uniref:Uncharacterized protein n=1 Tax=Paractinoplanes tereljensis TaxID=571912 RepID=A0A919TRH4_9ACTN|nr:hypothetical protein [Actinoplanes tereljensis]GIF18097.1 hypothetical protein Ate02nite_08270 [Actinoplanes tereljensis]
MTLTAPAAVLPETAEPAPGRDHSAVWCAVSLTVAGAAGAVALVAADRAAEWGHGRPFELFWLGMLVFTLPAAYWAGRRATSSRLRLAVIVAYACFTYLPKLLRNPTGPLYHDEFAHWRQSREILLDGRLFEANPIVRVVGDFPGLHSAVASVASLTGISVWHAALAVLIGAHLLLVLGVTVLAQEIWRDGRTAAIAALAYGLNSSFLFFDTQFGYESLAIALWVWTLVALVRAMRAPAKAPIAVLLIAATVVTHHLTALGLIATMLIIAVAATIKRRDAVAATAWLLTLTAAVLTTSWLLWVAPKTAGYLDPYLAKALNQFAGMFSDNGESGRTLFKQSIAPWWEQKTAFVAQGCALAAMTAAAVHLYRTRNRDPLALAMLVLGVCYFPAVLLILTPSGAEGARRSWAFSYLGIALVVAPLAVRLLDRWAGKAAAALLTVFAIVMVGNTAAGMNPSYRFPGPPVYGSDTRALIPEVAAAADWLRATQGRGLRIVADRYSGLIFGSFGGQDPVTGSVTFPTYDVYLTQPGQPVNPALIGQLSAWRFGYLVVDRRMAREVPEIGIYFENNEPIAHNGRPGFTLGQLTKFDHTPWTIKIYDSGNIAIYRFDFASLNVPAIGGGK